MNPTLKYDLFTNQVSLDSTKMAMAGEQENEDPYDALNCGSNLDEFKHLDEVKGLISNLPDIYEDQVAVEASCERFTCKSSAHRWHPES